MVSVIDTEQNISKLLPALDEMVDKGLIAMSEVEVIRLRAPARCAISFVAIMPI
jgi:PII-like signaling protein